jgi:hypothetical protein
MGCTDIFCLACGLPCHVDKGSLMQFAEDTNDEHIINEMKQLIKKTNYLTKTTFLTVDGRIVHGCKEIACNITFTNSKKEKFEQIGYMDRNYFGTGRMEKTRFFGYQPSPIQGTFIHTQCWKLIKELYGINLKYSDLPINISSHSYGKIHIGEPIIGINYGSITKYWWQEFDFMKLIEDKNTYMVDIKDAKNINRIKKIIMQFKLKFDDARIGPSVSATFFGDRSFRIGKNKGLWIKKNDRWQEIKEKMVHKTYIFKEPSKQLKKYINSMSMIAEVSELPVFIVKVEMKQKNQFSVDLVTVSSYVDALEKKLMK